MTFSDPILLTHRYLLVLQAASFAVLSNGSFDGLHGQLLELLASRFDGQTLEGPT